MSTVVQIYEMFVFLNCCNVEVSQFKEKICTRYISHTKAGDILKVHRLHENENSPPSLGFK